MAADLDDQVREYLLYRGFTTAARAFDAELNKAASSSVASLSAAANASGVIDKSCNVDKIVESIMNFISLHDMTNLTNVWNFLGRKFFTNLDAAQSSALRKIELSLFRCYLVNCVTSGRPEKILEFFEKSAKVLPQYDWGEWYGLPYIKNPELNDRFAPFFQRAWQETFVISLHNFLNIVFFTTPKPSLLNNKQEAVTMQNLKDENHSLKSQIASNLACDYGRNVGSSTFGGDASHSMLERPAAGVNYINGYSPSPSVNGTQDPKGSSISSHKTTNTNQTSGTSSLRTIQYPNLVRSTILSALPKTRKSGVQSGASKKKMSDAVIIDGKIGDTLSNSDSIKGKIVTSGLFSRPQSFSSQFERQVTSNSIGVASTAPRESMSSTQKAEPGNLSSSPSDRSVSKHSEHHKADAEEKTGSRNLLNRRPKVISPTTELLDNSKPDLGIKSSDPYILLSKDTYSEHEGLVNHCRFSPSGNYVASSDDAGTVKLWSNVKPLTTHITHNSKKPVAAIEWVNSKFGDMLLLGLFAKNQSSIRLYDVTNKRIVREKETPHMFPFIMAVASSPNSARFVSSQCSASHSMGSLVCWDMKTFQQERQLELTGGSTVRVYSIDFNHNGNMIALGCSDSNIRVIDVQKNESLMCWSVSCVKNTTVAVMNVKFSYDETCIYALSSEAILSSWSLHRPGVNFFEYYLGSKSALGFSPNATYYPRLFATDMHNNKFLLPCENGLQIIRKESDGWKMCQKVVTFAKAATCLDWSVASSTLVLVNGATSNNLVICHLLEK